MKKLICLVALLALVIGLVACSYGGTTTTSSWSNSGLSANSQASSWSITARSVNGNSLRRLDLTAAELANIHIVSSHTAGVVNVVLIQDGDEQVFSIESGFDGILDTSNFEAGRIRMRIVFANAQDVDIAVNWTR